MRRNLEQIILLFQYKSTGSSSQYIKHERQCFIGISKHLEESWKYDAQGSSFHEIRGDWIADDTMFLVFDISSESKQKLTSERRS